MAAAIEVLRGQWTRSGERLARRLDKLSDPEFFWQPVPDCWTVKPDPTANGRWTYDYERSEEHTSELQSRQYPVCRLLLEKKTQSLDLTAISAGTEPSTYQPHA